VFYLLFVKINGLLSVVCNDDVSLQQGEVVTSINSPVR